MIIYLDTCCYCRLFDNKTQAKIKAEAVAIRGIIENRILGTYSIVGSLVLIAEMEKIRDIQKRDAIIRLYRNTVVNEVVLSDKGLIRAHVLHLKGLGFMDSHHLIAAETAGADFLLTTDKAFIRISKEQNLSKVNVINPLNF